MSTPIRITDEMKQKAQAEFAQLLEQLIASINNPESGDIRLRNRNSPPNLSKAAI